MAECRIEGGVRVHVYKAAQRVCSCGKAKTPPAERRQYPRADGMKLKGLSMALAWKAYLAGTTVEAGA